ncbi:aerobic-type carbon monoxide dehydrogenase, middle subunit CoxM/CutM-like protein [Terriglobus roseus DSM 18391]|uniref:Aerobic-type carbon monoxide dehydrogenase, middle subunit CoxM/CutM-like protein n=1 Tax=Terriglobus roseus (strain DSM 18391 / NRRL B-41598 / KBS 63) TaxID=926566 RepID=I3ZGS4_TERRK|nr:xanthine dehydrogenase family protein subunit M [Terriglobus roseus]AFL88442.1 aerobic-type carbon monoxide dehydrogenase, middle subunit CoxM/CutM-like protein [Terriglobus roseus DSM 18391]AFL88785.1 aerobic-type carbon monoxide dehydrogenase, middle subunit CoxM/CutM-like protein [Terriglobus roseus DSM 18391]
MQPFELITPSSIPDAVKAQASAATAQQGSQVRYIAGGTNLVDYMKLNVEMPRQLVDINGLPLNKIEPGENGSLKIGALASNTAVAHHDLVKQQYPVLSEAILSGASTQLRNMASTAGNLLQKTRCGYYRDTSYGCNKRQPGTGCSAIGGHNRMLAILGTSDKCIASNPSDQNVALAALEAKIHITGAKGDRVVPIADFYTLPGNTPQRETVLEPGDLITHVSIPALPSGAKSLYLKLRDRASYEFALTSAAIVIKTSGNHIDFVRVALGGVGAVPWRSREAEKALMGKAATPANFRAAAEAALHGARPQSQNGFKVELAKRCLTAALTKVTA